MNTLSRIILNLFHTSDLCQTPQISIISPPISIRPPQISISPPQFSIRPFLDLCSFSQNLNFLFLYPPRICVCRSKPNVPVTLTYLYFFFSDNGINPALCQKMLKIYIVEKFMKANLSKIRKICVSGML
jgi:hypothetical protein